MKFILGLILFSASLLVAYPLREVIFFTGEVAAKDSGTWQEYYNAILGILLLYIHIKGFVLLFKPITHVSYFRVLRGIILCSIFLLFAFNDSLNEMLIFRNSRNFAEAAINGGWALIALYGFVKGLYCIWAGNRFIPGVDDGDWNFSFSSIINAPSTPNNECVNKNIQSVLDYRDSKIAMMPNDRALAELSKTAGVEMYVNNNSTHAKYLDSQLAMKTNEEGLNYIQNMFGNNK